MTDPPIAEPCNSETDRQVGQNEPVLSPFNAKYDGDAIASWRLNLGKIRRDFEVRCSNFVGPSLSFRSQTGLTMKTDADVSNVHHEASSSHVNAHNPSYDASSASLVVPDARHDVSNANTVKPDVQVRGNKADEFVEQFFKDLFKIIRYDLSKKIELFMVDILNAIVDESRTTPPLSSQHSCPSLWTRTSSVLLLTRT